MADVISVSEVSNSVVNSTEIRNSKGDLIAKVTREYGVLADPKEVLAFEQAILAASAELVIAE